MVLYNKENNTPNILHFHGENINQLAQTFKMVREKYIVNTAYNGSMLSIVSTWTDDEKCVLLEQCKKFDIPLINCVPDTYDRTQPWYMPNKIKFFIETLKNIHTEYVLFLDGYDVLLTGLNDIIEKFEKQKYRILFGPSCNNYPEVIIDQLYGRSKMGTYRYFNAGCCMGHRDDLLKFYEEALEHIDEPNYFNSEQLVMRYAFAKYSCDQKQTFVGIDYKCDIFQSMGCIDSNIDYDTEVIKIGTNKLVPKQYIVTGSDGFIGKHLVSALAQNKTNIIYGIDRKNGTEAKEIETLLKNHEINCVFHLAAQTSVFNDDLEQICEDNMATFIKVCELCEKYGVKLIYASSSTANRDNTTSLYGLSKRFNEEFAKIYCPTSVGIRLHNVYGKVPREGTLYWHLLHDEETVLYNKGENIRCYTYVDDAVKAIMTCEYITNMPLVNCVNYEPITTQQFADIVKKYNPDVKYKLIEEKRDKDNLTQEVDKNVPLVNIQYQHLKQTAQ